MVGIAQHGASVVSTHSRPKAAGINALMFWKRSSVSTHSRPKAAGQFLKALYRCYKCVSTHSRPKAAGSQSRKKKPTRHCFNTQPPEGGWGVGGREFWVNLGFNTQPPEGGWLVLRRMRLLRPCFNTQPPEGGWGSKATTPLNLKMFQHTAARKRLGLGIVSVKQRLTVSTHSRPKAAG